MNIWSNSFQGFCLPPLLLHYHLFKTQEMSSGIRTEEPFNICLVSDRWEYEISLTRPRRSWLLTRMIPKVEEWVRQKSSKNSATLRILDIFDQTAVEVRTRKTRLKCMRPIKWFDEISPLAHVEAMQVTVQHCYTTYRIHVHCSGCGSIAGLQMVWQN